VRDGRAPLAVPSFHITTSITATFATFESFSLSNHLNDFVFDALSVTTPAAREPRGSGGRGVLGPTPRPICPGPYLFLIQWVPRNYLRTKNPITTIGYILLGFSVKFYDLVYFFLQLCVSSPLRDLVLQLRYFFLQLCALPPLR
jgi:hypothetical protein